MCSNGNKCSELENAELDRDSYFVALTSCYNLAKFSNNELILDYLTKTVPEVVAEFDKKPKWRSIA